MMGKNFEHVGKLVDDKGPNSRTKLLSAFEIPFLYITLSASHPLSSQLRELLFVTSFAAVNGLTLIACS
jgi:hypothetical protein